MAGSFAEAFDARYQAIQQSRVGSGTYGTGYKVNDLASVYGSQRALAEAYAEKYGVKVGSAQKALSRLKRYEAGVQAPDVRSGAAQVQSRLNELGRERVGGQALPTPGVSGMSGGAVDITGQVEISPTYPGDSETREINMWPLTSQQADELAIVSHEQGEAEASQLFMVYYEFSGAKLTASEVDFYTVGW